MRLLGLLDELPIPIAYRLAFLTNFHREPLLRRMEREHGLIRPEWTVMICLARREDVAASDVAAFTEQPRNTVGRAVASLEERGLLTRRADGRDARRATLRLTREGRALHDRIMPMYVAAEARMLEPLDAAQRETLLELLDALARDVPRWSDGGG